MLFRGIKSSFGRLCYWSGKGGVLDSRTKGWQEAGHKC